VFIPDIATWGARNDGRRGALEDHWHLMGAMEALNGWLLFGLTTAFLFAVIEKVWSIRR
jgi:hypothetical protein